MIRVNEENYKVHTILTDNVVIDITNEGVDPDVTLSAIVDAHGQLNDTTTLKVYIPSNLDADTPRMEFDNQRDGEPYAHFVSDSTIVDLDDIQTARDVSKNIRGAFDKFSRRYLGHENTFTEIDTLSNEDIMYCIQDALGILPTLMNEDIPCEEKRRLSKIGADLMWADFMEDETTKEHNPYPTREEIETYEKMNPYEKRLIRDPNMHPLYLLHAYMTLQEQQRGALFTEEIRDQLHHGKVSEISIVNTHFPEYQDALSYMDEQFKQKMHRSPRVLNEIVAAILERQKGIFSKNVIDHYVDKFSVPAIQKIAKYHNKTLFAIADKLNFAEVKDEHILLFASYLHISKVSLLEERGFFKWYEKNKNINTNDLLSVIEHAGDIKEFTPDMTAKELIFEIGQQRGKSDAKKMEERYHYQFGRNVVGIKGRNIVVNDDKYTILMLPADDFRNFTVGIDTNCCQVYGNAGESCVYKATSDPYAGIVAIVKNSQIKDNKWVEGPCIGQAFTWTDEINDTIVFDNMEFRRTGAENFDKKISEFNDIIAMWAEAMPYKNVHIGVGYNMGMNGWGQKISKMVQMPNTLNGNSYTYSDYHDNARTIKKDGHVLLSPKKDPALLKVTHTPLEENKFDKLQGFEWAVGIMPTIDRDIAFVEAWKEEQTDELKQTAYEYNYRTIQYMDEVPIAIQQDVAARHPDMIPYIKNPDESVALIVIQNNPNSIFNISNASKECWKAALQGNGLLLEQCPYHDDELVNVALEQNGFAVKFVPVPTIQQQLTAVHQTKDALSFIASPCNEAILYATGRDSSLVMNLKETDIATQMALIEQRPSNILSMDHPDPAVIERAISLDGLLIKNFKRKSEVWDHLAVQQNGFAIRYIPNQTRELMEEAYRQNPKSIKYMQLNLQEKQEFINTMQQEVERA